KRAVSGDLTVCDLAHELRQAPAGGLVHPRRRGEGGGWRLVLLEHPKQVAQGAFVEAGADVADRLQLPVAVHAQEARAERLPVPALPLGPAAAAAAPDARRRAP